MDLVFTLEHRFERTPDGKVWTRAAFEYSLWKRYLDVFDRVQVVSRVRDVETVQAGRKRADGKQVSFKPIPHFIGPLQYLRNFGNIRKLIRECSSGEASYIMRVPSLLGTLMLRELKKRDHPYGLEVVGDPRDVFAPGVLRHALRPLFRYFFSRNLVAQCAQADAVSYVTERTLQQRYPCPAFSISASTVDLPSDAYTDGPHLSRNSGVQHTLVFVGSLAQLYKAPHVLIDAVGTCVEKGLDVRLIMVGDGRYRSELESRAVDLGLADRVTFIGQVQAGREVREQLDKADLFVLPSFTEGLPSAMLEAMARGLPCIGTDVGGIPELLPDEDMVPPGDAPALAEKILEVLVDTTRLTRMAERNLQKARQYSEAVLQSRRVLFCQQVLAATEKRC